MAEATKIPPTERPPTDSDYKPVSGVAIAAMVLACLLVLLMLLLGGNSFLKRKPLFSTWLLLAAVVGFGVSIAARVQIRRSEGTRSGMQLAGVAWWITLLVGAGYGAYFYASKLALAKQSETYAVEWLEMLKSQGNPDPNLRETKLAEAFVRILDPKARSSFNSSEKDRFGPLLSSRLARLLQRNGDDVTVVPLSVSNLEQLPTGYHLDQMFRLRCPEGVFNITLSMFAYEGRDYGNGREWVIIPVKDTDIIPQSITKYGHVTAILQYEANQMTADWLTFTAGHQWESSHFLTVPFADRPPIENWRGSGGGRGLLKPVHFLVGGAGTFMMPDINTTAEPAARVFRSQVLGAAVAGGAVLGVLEPYRMFEEMRSRNFFLVDGETPKSLSDISIYRTLFRFGMMMPVSDPRMSLPESSPQLWVGANDIRVVVPAIIFLPINGGSMGFAKVTVQAKNPELVEALKKLREDCKANPDESASAEQSMDFLKAYPRDWQIISIDSNLRPLQTGGQSGQAGQNVPQRGPNF